MEDCNTPCACSAEPPMTRAYMVSSPAQTFRVSSCPVVSASANYVLSDVVGRRKKNVTYPLSTISLISSLDPHAKHSWILTRRGYLVYCVLHESTMFLIEHNPNFQLTRNLEHRNPGVATAAQTYVIEKGPSQHKAFGILRMIASVLHSSKMTRTGRLD